MNVLMEEEVRPVGVGRLPWAEPVERIPPTHTPFLRRLLVLDPQFSLLLLEGGANRGRFLGLHRGGDPQPGIPSDLTIRLLTDLFRISQKQI